MNKNELVNTVLTWDHRSLASQFNYRLYVILQEQFQPKEPPSLSEIEIAGPKQVDRDQHEVFWLVGKDFARRPQSLSSERKEVRDKTTRAATTAI